MNTLIWKLLRQHISASQLIGFTIASLLGMTIVLLSIQFYRDIAPIFNANDSFFKKDYIIVTKKISALNTFTKKNSTFSDKEIEALKEQPFTSQIGSFTSSMFKVSAGLNMPNTGKLSTEMFFESVPDEFIDIELNKWKFEEDTRNVPIVIPKNYLDLYNFGFAQSQNLPKISESLISLINIDLKIRGNQKEEHFTGNIVGFSNRLNTILVPQDFMNWANKNFSTGTMPQPSRLIIEVNNAADPAITSYFQQRGYEAENGKLDTGKTSYFLRLITSIVASIGIIICILSFYILVLSIFLLLQKNAAKMENLLLIGYSPAKVALPYQLLAIALNALVVIGSLVIVSIVRDCYISRIDELLPSSGSSSLSITIGIGLLLFVAISAMNLSLIYKQIISIWTRKK